MSKIKLSTDRLTIGLYIQLPNAWRKHPFLFNSFIIKDQQQVRALQSLDFDYVICIPQKSTNAPLPINKAQDKSPTTTPQDLYLDTLWQEKERRIEEQKLYLRTLRDCEHQFKKSLAIVRSINLKVVNQTAQALHDATELITGLTEKMNKANRAVLHLMEEGKEGDKHHSHVLHVAILSMLLGKALGLSKQELVYLGIGSLFHDIGKSRVPTQILRNRPHVTAAENNYYKMHVRFALDKTNHIANFPEPVLDIISQHHEFLDGTGYPKKLKGDNINLLTQIVTIVNEYDNMCNPTDKHPARSPYSSLAFLYKNRGDKLNKKVLRLLIKELGVYPPGSIVQLNNGKIALVMSVSKENILQPNVMIYDSSIPKHDAAIISLSEKELKIEKVLQPTKLPENITEYLTPRTRVNYYFEENN